MTEKLLIEISSGNSFNKVEASKIKLWLKCLFNLCTEELWNIQVISDWFAAPGVIGTQCLRYELKYFGKQVWRYLCT